MISVKNFLLTLASLSSNNMDAWSHTLLFLRSPKAWSGLCLSRRWTGCPRIDGTEWPWWLLRDPQKSQVWDLWCWRLESDYLGSRGWFWGHLKIWISKRYVRLIYRWCASCVGLDSFSLVWYFVFLAPCLILGIHESVYSFAAFLTALNTFLSGLYISELDDFIICRKNNKFLPIPSSLWIC